LSIAKGRRVFFVASPKGAPKLSHRQVPEKRSGEAGILSVSDSRPRARPLDPIPVEVQGQQLIVLRDPLGISEDVAVAPLLYLFLAHCDGQNTVRDIKLALARRFQFILTPNETEKILEELDKYYLLDTDRYRNKLAQVIEEYRREKIRRPAHAGKSYPDNPEALKAELDSYYLAADGPGTLPSPSEPTGKPMAALIAPHISVQQGGTCFAWAYERLSQSPPADTYVILGTGHAQIPGCFAATRKNFETPFGLAETDTEFLDHLEENFGGDLCAQEIYHRTEHVIEFQLIFLQHSLRRRARSRIVPILCSYGPESLDRNRSGEDNTASIVEKFCNALRQTIAETDRRICIIASADLAHVGHRYGDPVELGREDLVRLEHNDRAMLEIVCAGDADGFLENLLADGNRRRICGFPCIYAMLKALDLRNGELLRYGQSAMDERNSTVSYASVVYYET